MDYSNGSIVIIIIIAIIFILAILWVFFRDPSQKLGGLNAVCNNNTDCLGQYVCDNTLRICRVPTGQPCSMNGDCVDGATCIGGRCSGVIPNGVLSSRAKLEEMIRIQTMIENNQTM